MDLIIWIDDSSILKDDYDGSIDEFFFLFTSFIEYTNYKFLEATTTFFVSLQNDKFPWLFSAIIMILLNPKVSSF